MPMPANPDYIYCKLPPGEIALFRYLLEAHDNLAQFTVLEKHTALIKIFFPAENYQLVQKFLDEIAGEISLFHEITGQPLP